MRRPAFAALVLSVAVAGCSGHPTSPSATTPGAPAASAAPSASAAPPPSTGSAPPATSATIRGAVALPSGGQAIGGQAFSSSGMSVSLVGTDISSRVDERGVFSLAGVPPGDQRLRFAGHGHDATAPVHGIRQGEAITIQVAVSGSSAVIEADSRHPGSQVEIEGLVESLPPTAAPDTVVVAGRTIRVDPATTIREGGTQLVFEDLRVGFRVHVRARSLEGALVAESVVVQNRLGTAPPPTPPPAPAPDPGQDESASIHGTLASISGSSPTLTLVVGGTTVRTSATTEVRRRGDVQPLTALALGQSLHVVGTRHADRSLDARFIRIDDDGEGGAFEISGPAGGVSGACPALSFVVMGYAINTDASTSFVGGVCTALRSGHMVRVKGTRLADGRVRASEVAR